MKFKRLFSMVLCLCMVLGTASFNVFAEGEAAMELPGAVDGEEMTKSETGLEGAPAPAGPVEVATFDELVAAIKNGGEIKLTADIKTTSAIVTSGVNATIDLNGKTLTIGAGDNKFNDASNITVKNGNIDITGVTVDGNAIICLDEYEETLVTTLILDNVNLTGDGYSSAYGIFYIGDSSVLNVNGGKWNLKNDTFEAGGIFKADEAKATLNIDGLNLTAHNVRRVVTYANTTIANSTMNITGDADGVDAEMEHGFNRSPLTITNSTITMKDMVGRGITAECGAVTISENSTVTITNAQEATIDIRGSQSVTVDSTSTVIVDAEPTVAEGSTVSGVTVNYPVYIDETGYKSVVDAFAAADDGDEVVIKEAGTYSVPASKNITITGAVDGVVFDNIGAHNMGGANVTFNNVTFDYYPNVNYTGLQHAGVMEYNNCTINGQVFLYGTSETFNNCTFNQNSADAYNVWTYGAKAVEFNKCTFNSAGKSVLIYSEDANLVNNVKVTDCDFVATQTVNGKAAIEMDSSLTAGINLTVDNLTTATGFSTNTVSGSDLWNNKKGNATEANNDITVVVGDEIVLNPVAFPGYVEVDTYEKLVAALETANAKVIMTADITADATQNSGYGKAGIVLETGDILEGDGHKLTINGANSTWDCAIAMKGGTVKNLTVANGFRGIFMPGANGDVVIDGVKFENVVYTFNSDAGSKDYSVTIKNSTLNGWTSYSNVHKSVTFENCTFGEGNGYAFCRPYQATEFIGSAFDKDFSLDVSRSATDSLEFNECTYNGTPISYQNDDLFYGSGSVLVDGKKLKSNLPTATVTSVENDDLTFALNFKADEASAEQLNYYGDWYADFVLTINKDVTFNANGGADGYLSGQYDTYSENWVNVPFEDVTIKAGEPLKIMEYAATLMGESGLKLTYNDVYSFVKDFNCGVFFEEEFLAANPDLEVALELRMYNNEDESESYAIGETYNFEVEDLRIFSLASAYVDYLPISLYPDNIKLYRLGLYSAAEGTDYNEYGFEITVDGQEPVMVKAEKYDGEIMLRVGMDRIDNLKPSNFDYNGSNNVCIFGQTIAFDESAVGENKVKYRPYVVIDGKTHWGYTFTAPNIYTK